MWSSTTTLLDCVFNSSWTIMERGIQDIKHWLCRLYSLQSINCWLLFPWVDNKKNIEYCQHYLFYAKHHWSHDCLLPKNIQWLSLLSWIKSWVCDWWYYDLGFLCVFRSVCGSSSSSSSRRNRIWKKGATEHWPWKALNASPCPPNGVWVVAWNQFDFELTRCDLIYNFPTEL